MTTDTLTERQLLYVSILAEKLKITSLAMDAYCRDQFGADLREMTKQQCSQLIDTMVSWKTAPPEVRRAMGQIDLFTLRGEPT